ncbi:hypothetical protein [Chelatococcus sp.]|uniref:DUF6456 domain-containing protein n=1 Tax=Chelatococcus sp. TaxID=1953771 RepID=UPI001ED587B4|nr:hypothetical protein [Chelatococcus sp.]MBX3546884.1 hypothetical protein [Chelatococcus sp.]
MARPGRKRKLKSKQIRVQYPPMRSIVGVGATPERLLKSGIETVCDLRSRRIMAVAGLNAIGKEDGVVRANPSPLNWLASRGMLDADPDRNRILKEAGERYYLHWFQGGLKGIGAIDYSQLKGGNGDPAYLIPTSERAAYHRQHYRAARERMGNWLARIADAVVCEEMTLAEAGEFIGEYASKETRSAIARSILQGALTTLAQHFGMLKAGA